jgi:osmoprotectant transport system ATP-binding protein
MTSPADIVIEFRTASYHPRGEAPRLKALSLQVRRGELLVLLGRSGSGKTTTLKLINRLLIPTAGEVLVEGRPTTAWDPIRLRRRIGYVIQEVGLFPHLTVRENIALVPTLEGWTAARTDARVRELLELVGLDPALFAHRYPHELSGGQRQRVGLARALAADPPILLLDEPFGALDPITRLEIRAEFLRLHHRLSKTTLFVTHDVHEALTLATRIALLDCGRLVALCPPDDFLRLEQEEARCFLRAFWAAHEKVTPRLLSRD